MSLFAFKLLAALAVFACGLGVGLLPLRMSRAGGGQRFFGFANAMAGGIFLGAALIHMFPDGDAALAAAGFEYPLVGLLAGAGFFLVLLIERGLMAGREETDVATAAGGGALYPFVLLLVLSVHSLIAGATLGLETTMVATAAIIVAILAHKGSAAFALGVSMLRGGVPAGRAGRLVAVFALSTPLGILVGTLAGTQLEGATAQLVEGCFDGLAAGTFLYVAVLDILAEEFEQPDNRWAKLTLVLAGIAVMAVVAVWA